MLRRHQYSGPDNAVELEDILGHDVVVGRPKAIPEILITGKGQSAQVVDQSIHPNVDDLFFVPRHRDAPVQGSPRNGDILQTLINEGKCLVVSVGGADEIWIRSVMLGKTILIGRETEEVILLFHIGGQRTMVGTEAVYQVILRVVRLALRAIETLVATGIDISIIVATTQKLLNELLMLRIRGTDEEIIGSVHPLCHVSELAHHVIRMLPGTDPSLLCRLSNLAAVLIRAGQEEDIITQLPVETSQHVSRYCSVGVTYVRSIVHIVDWGSGVELAHRRVILTDCLSQPMPPNTLADEVLPSQGHPPVRPSLTDRLQSLENAAGRLESHKRATRTIRMGKGGDRLVSTFGKEAQESESVSWQARSHQRRGNGGRTRKHCHGDAFLCAPAEQGEAGVR